ncbi:unnamed protein product [Adineta steineri]|uniref:F-box domain-containing protein n=1 Tax=Adineta steineri TaxID=433720 RepID=A0A815LQJ6_9BILA|nr:unnamed protein product [Adineta steineri]CAF1617766.1 unnamed protein product [Adineta steineri]
MFDKTTMSLHTLPVELVYRILDYQTDLTIVISMRNVCQRLNKIVDTYSRYQTLDTLDLFSYEIGDVGAQRLAGSLYNNTVINYFFLLAILLFLHRQSLR